MSDSSIKLLLTSLLLLLILSGCSSAESGDESISSVSSNTGLPTVNLTSDRYAVEFNSNIILNWSAKDVVECSTSGFWNGIKGVEGSETIGPLTGNMTFTLNCTGSKGETTDSVNIFVNDPPASLPIISLQTSSDTVMYDGSTVLNWSSSYASACIASGDWTGSKSVTGSQTIDSLKQNSTFVLSCTGESGTANYSVDVNVIPPALPSVTLSSSASTVTANGSSLISWTSENATNCTASGDWSGEKDFSGSEQINSIVSNSTFIISCSGEGGNDEASISVAVADPVLPTVTFSASQSSIESNGSTTLSWSSADASSCIASGDWTGEKDISGSQAINSIISDSTFNLSCSGIGGTANFSVNVSVVMSHSGTALLSWTPPTSNEDNSTLTDLAGYNIYYGTSPGDYSNTITVSSAGVSSYLVESLAVNTWYFAMTSFNTSNIESAYSEEVSKVIN